MVITVVRACGQQYTEGTKEGLIVSAVWGPILQYSFLFSTSSLLEIRRFSQCSVLQANIGRGGLRIHLGAIQAESGSSHSRTNAENISETQII